MQKKKEGGKRGEGSSGEGTSVAVVAFFFLVLLAGERKERESVAEKGPGALLSFFFP